MNIGRNISFKGIYLSNKLTGESRNKAIKTIEAMEGLPSQLWWATEVDVDMNIVPDENGEPAAVYTNSDNGKVIDACGVVKLDDDIDFSIGSPLDADDWRKDLLEEIDSGVRAVIRANKALNGAHLARTWNLWPDKVKVDTSVLDALAARNLYEQNKDGLKKVDAYCIHRGQAYPGAPSKYEGYVDTSKL